MRYKQKYTAALSVIASLLFVSSCGVAAKPGLTPPTPNNTQSSQTVSTPAETAPAVTARTATVTVPLLSATPVIEQPTTPTPDEPLITVTGEIVVKATNSGFTPGLVYAPVGTIVIWQNSEPYFQGCCPRCHVNHGVSSDDGTLNGMLSIRDVYAHYFGTPGTYRYFDSAHPELTGTVVVEAGRTAIESKAAESPSPTPFIRPGYGSLEGSVQIPPGILPQEISVWLFQPANRSTPVSSVSVTPEGRYRLSNIPAGSYVMYVTVTGGNIPIYFMPSSKPVVISPDGVTAAETIFLPA